MKQEHVAHISPWAHETIARLIATDEARFPGSRFIMADIVDDALRLLVNNYRRHHIEIAEPQKLQPGRRSRDAT